LNEAVDELIAGLDDPLKAETLKLSLANKATGNWVTPKDTALKEAFWPEIQAALLGQEDPQEALDTAEDELNRVLRRR
jgi:ABC-type glycerol-3-phosphate transport system substrate-binding protein